MFFNPDTAYGGCILIYIAADQNLATSEKEKYFSTLLLSQDNLKHKLLSDILRHQCIAAFKHTEKEFLNSDDMRFSRFGD